MRSNALLTLSVLAAAIVVGCLALRKPTPTSPMVDPVDAMTSAQIYGQSEPPQTLEEAVATLEKKSGVRIMLDWAAFEAFGITHEPRIPEVSYSVGTSLRTLLRAYSRTPANRTMAIPIRFSATADGALLVSLDRNAVRQLRIYDVHDLLSDTYWGVPRGPVRAYGLSNTSHEAQLLDDLRFWLNVDQDEPLPNGYFVPMDPVTLIDGKLMMITTPAKHARLARVLASLRALK